jgi:hypothetical protein
MIITSGIQYRSFAAQNEFSFSFDVVNSISSGVSQIGFSGDENTLPIFNFKNGNIFDLNNNYIWSYNPREVVNFSGNIGSGYINYFINQRPICLFSPKLNNSYYDFFYIKNSGGEIEYNFYIEGQIPNYNIIFPQSGFLGQNLTGLIQNTEEENRRSFKIFSGNVFNENTDYEIQSFPLFVISGNQSGQIILKPEFAENINITETTPSQLNLFLNTNFGNIQNPISFDLIPAPIYFIDLLTGYTGGTGLIDNFTFGQFYNFELRTIYPDPLDITILIKISPATLEN